ncbi:hypothetical protein PPL_04039 [Heterostelium album PN500]|uniref:EGF-like domain-containing protein n=1 Tax=Heterostelium pallidum (strain ATCC 26659 / Pp 5 / PN500) TaxID=670386 RepID=D3B5V1_HETP5|nr:hypothetical protein PPL_04039 [Heterostelium album PN500]EFA83249.1 hypothetical protein PPL_04039 [Heterostelium album PN500]|eukprot:XP_020435366.1 hypothetical protein PPL_04039 [Heterostelium album PN500]
MINHLYLAVVLVSAVMDRDDDKTPMPAQVSDGWKLYIGDRIFEWNSETKSYADAISVCKGNGGWLATPNHLEFAQLANSGFLTSRSFVNGFNQVGSLDYSYSADSPYLGMQFYNYLTQQCKTTCFFAPESMIYPSTSNKGVAVEGNSANNITHYATDVDKQLPFICQFVNDTVSKAHMYPTNTVPTTGGQLRIFFKVEDTDDIPVTVPEVTWQGLFLAFSDNSSVDLYTYSVPGGINSIPISSSYKATDGEKINSSTSIVYEPPLLSYFSVGTGDIVTIVGENFGNTVTDIQIKVGPIQCLDITDLDNFAISCQLASSVDHFFPITVNVSSITTTVYSLPYYSQSTKSFLQLISFSSNYTSSIKLARLMTVGTFKAYIGVVTSIPEVNEVKLIYPSVFPENFMEGIAWNNTVDSFIYTDGPNIRSSTIPYTRANIDPALLVEGLSYKFNINTMELTSAIQDQQVNCTTLIRYFNPVPKYRVLNVQGTTFTLDIGNYGSYFSVIKVIQPNGNPASVSLTQYISQRSVILESPLYQMSECIITVDDVVALAQDPIPIINSVSRYAVSSRETSLIIYGYNFQGFQNAILGSNALTIATLINSTAIAVTVPVEGKDAMLYIQTQYRGDKFVIYETPVFVGDYLTNATSKSHGYVHFYMVNISPNANITLYDDIAKQVIPIFEIVSSNETIVKMPAGDRQYFLHLYVNDRISNGITYQNLPTHFKIDSYRSVRFQQPGNVTLIGSGFYNDLLSITIGGLACDQIFFISTTELVCNYKASVPSNKNGDALTIEIKAFLDQIVVLSQQIFYYITDYECPNKCSGHGDCQKTTGTCICQSGWSLRDCSFQQPVNKPQPPPLPPVTTDEGVTILSGESSLDFSIGLYHIREVDDSAQVHNQVSMKNISWQQPSNGTYIGTFKENSCRIQLNVDIIVNATNHTFAGETILLDANSVKFTVNITQWTFKSPLNTLEIIYITKASASNTDDLCTNPVEESDQQQSSLSYYQVRTPNSILQAKFASRLILESRITKSVVRQLDLNDALYKDIISSKGEYNLLTAVVSPSFSTYCTIDPNYSLLLTGNDEKLTCGDEDNNKWRLPVIVVCSVVGATILVLATVFLVKKRLQGRRISDMDAKSYDDAASQCLTDGGYLATILTRAEADWIVNEFGASAEGWISGSNMLDNVNYDSWRYATNNNNKDEANLIFYQTTIDLCTTYCPWNWDDMPRTPTYVNQTAFFYSNGSAMMSARDPTNELYYFCEQNPTPPVFVSSVVPTRGGQLALTIDRDEKPTNILYAIGSSTIVVSFSYSYPIIMVTIPEGSGSIQYMPPSIQYIYPPTTANQWLTIVGDNLGNSTMDKSVLFEKTNNECPDVEVLVPHTSIRCKVSRTYPGRILPLKLTVGQLQYLAYQPPFILPNLKPCQIAYRNIGYKIMVSKVSHLNVVAERNSFVSVVADSSFVFAIQKIISSSIYYQKMAQGLDFVSSSKTWIYTNAPYSGQEVTPYLPANFPTYGPPPMILNYNISLTVGSPTLPYAVFNEFYGPKPSIPGRISLLPTSGGTLSLDFSNKGFYYSKFTCSIAGCTVSNPRPTSSQLDVTFPAGVGTGIPFAVLIDDITSNLYTYSYMLPNITSIDRLSPTEIQINGENFHTNISTINILPVNTILTITITSASYNRIVATIPSKVAPDALFVEVGGQRSNTFVYFENIVIDRCTSIDKGVRGNVTIFGSNFTPGYLNITIGKTSCTNNYFINTSLVICDTLLNEDINAQGDALPINIISMTSNMNKLNATRSIFYYTTRFVCPGRTECSGNGICRPNGQCTCAEGYTSIDCSQKVDVITPTPVPTPNDEGGVVLPSTSDKLKFEINVKYLRELEDSVTKKTLDTANIKWKIVNQSEDSLEYHGDFDNDGCQLQLYVDIVKEKKIIEFAGEYIELAANSVKFQIHVSNWTFSSRLSILQLVFATEINVDSDSLCEVPTTTTDNASWLEIKSGGTIVSARFAHYLYIDDRITKSSIKVLDNTDSLYQNINNGSNTDDKKAFRLLSAVEVPHFDKGCIVDPNFGLLVTSDQDNLCGSDKNKWKLPVIVVCSVVGAMLVITISAVVIKKQLAGRRVIDVIKLKKRGSLSSNFVI